MKIYRIETRVTISITPAAISLVTLTMKATMTEKHRENRTISSSFYLRCRFENAGGENISETEEKDIIGIHRSDLYTCSAHWRSP